MKPWEEFQQQSAKPWETFQKKNEAPPQQFNIGVAGLPQAIRETLPQFGPVSKALMGAYSTIDQHALRLKQAFGGGLSPQDEAAVIANRTILQESPAALAGNVAMNILGLGKVAPASLLGSMALGGALGAAEPVLEGESAAKNIAAGAAFGAAGNLAGRGISRVIKPKAVERAGGLIREGVTPTPGQALGGFAQRAEEGLTSVPVLGDAIRSGQRRAVEQFNRAAINRALTPIGKDIGKKVGREAVREAGEMVSQAYDDLLPKLKVVADPDFVTDIQGLRTLAQGMPTQRADQFANILKNEVLGKFTKQGRMHPETMKAVESKLGGLIRLYGKSQDADQRLLSDALKEAQAALRRMVERGNPNYAGELAKVNTAYANLLRVENAAGRVGSAEGVFSPEALRGATRAMDSSLRKRAFSQGRALMQDLAESGVDVLGKKVPDSGTPFRALMASGPLGVGTGVLASPLGLFYTPLGQQAVTGLLTRRPEFATPVAGAFRTMGRVSPLLGPSLLQSLPE